MNLCAIKPIDNIKKGKCKTCLYVWDLFVFYCSKLCCFSDGLTNGMFGSRLRKRRCCRHSRSRRYDWRRRRWVRRGWGWGGSVSCFLLWGGWFETCVALCCCMNRAGLVALSWFTVRPLNFLMIKKGRLKTGFIILKLCFQTAFILYQLI